MDRSRLLHMHPPGASTTWSESPGGDVIRGIDRDELGGYAGASGGSARYIYCGNCSKEPLTYETAAIMKVRAMGWPMKMHGKDVNVDILECPSCGTQVIR